MAEIAPNINRNKPFKHFNTTPPIVFVFLFILMGWSLQPNALRPFQIYCAPPNLSSTIYVYVTT